VSYGIHYATGCALDLIGFTYSDWVGDETDHNSTSGYVLSSTEDEYNHSLFYLPQRMST
jgi:hypothetical protein